jgi:hypothetical protein
MEEKRKRLSAHSWIPCNLTSLLGTNPITRRNRILHKNVLPPPEDAKEWLRKFAGHSGITDRRTRFILSLCNPLPRLAICPLVVTKGTDDALMVDTTRQEQVFSAKDQRRLVGLTPRTHVFQSLGRITCSKPISQNHLSTSSGE